MKAGQTADSEIADQIEEASSTVTIDDMIDDLFDNNVEEPYGLFISDPDTNIWRGECSKCKQDGNRWIEDPCIDPFVRSLRYSEIRDMASLSNPVSDVRF